VNKVPARISITLGLRGSSSSRSSISACVGGQIPHFGQMICSSGKSNRHRVHRRIGTIGFHAAFAVKSALHFPQVSAFASRGALQLGQMAIIETHRGAG
jgi:hypothetical protein